MAAVNVGAIDVSIGQNELLADGNPILIPHLLNHGSKLAPTGEREAAKLTLGDVETFRVLPVKLQTAIVLAGDLAAVAGERTHPPPVCSHAKPGGWQREAKVTEVEVHQALLVLVLSQQLAIDSGTVAPFAVILLHGRAHVVLPSHVEGGAAVQAEPLPTRAVPSRRPVRGSGSRTAQSPPATCPAC